MKALPVRRSPLWRRVAEALLIVSILAVGAVVLHVLVCLAGRCANPFAHPGRWWERSPWSY
jgi:hypothetical protein